MVYADKGKVLFKGDKITIGTEVSEILEGLMEIDPIIALTAVSTAEELHRRGKDEKNNL